MSLGHRIDARKVDEQVLLMMIDRKDEKRSSKTADDDFEEVMLSLAGDDGAKISLQDDQLLLNSRQRSREYDVDKTRNTIVGKKSGNPEVLNFKAGVFEKEMSLYYDEDVSEDRIFVSRISLSKKFLFRISETWMLFVYYTLKQRIISPLICLFINFVDLQQQRAT